jgi:hypothetical protein
MENKRYEPMIAATYPAAMAGLCLTTLAIISSQFYVSKWIVILLSAASLAFITSSFSIFWNALLIVGGESRNTQNQDKTLWWSISKGAFLIGIVFVFIAIILIFYNFCLTSFELFTHPNSSLPSHAPV